MKEKGTLLQEQQQVVEEIKKIVERGDLRKQ